MKKKMFTRPIGEMWAVIAVAFFLGRFSVGFEDDLKDWISLLESSPVLLGVIVTLWKLKKTKDKE